MNRMNRMNRVNMMYRMNRMNRMNRDEVVWQACQFTQFISFVCLFASRIYFWVLHVFPWSMLVAADSAAGSGVKRDAWWKCQCWVWCSGSGYGNLKPHDICVINLEPNSLSCHPAWWHHGVDKDQTCRIGQVKFSPVITSHPNMRLPLGVRARHP